jgi:phosphoglucomutase
MDPRAGTPAQPSDLVDVDALLAAYYDRRPDLDDPAQRVAVRHQRAPRVLAGLVQRAHIAGDHAGDLRVPPAAGHQTARCSSAATPTRCPSPPADRAGGAGRQRRGRDAGPPRRLHPTPAVSHAILSYNRGRRTGGPGRRHRRDAFAQPAATAASSTTRRTAAPPSEAITVRIEAAANACWRSRLGRVRRVPQAQALRAATTHRHDFLGAYVDDLAQVLDMDAIRAAGVRIGADPLGGAASLLGRASPSTTGST